MTQTATNERSFENMDVDLLHLHMIYDANLSQKQFCKSDYPEAEF